MISLVSHDTDIVLDTVSKIYILSHLFLVGENACVPSNLKTSHRLSNAVGQCAESDCAETRNCALEIVIF